MRSDLAEFTLSTQRQFRRSSPAGWLIQHVLPYWYLVLMMLVGAFGNAALAAVVPVYIGRAFSVALAHAPDAGQQMLSLAVFVALSQVVRGVLQLGRNFGAELIGQNLERDIRDELYLSLLGKSMTFHSLQPVGDTMARAINDVREINLMFSPGVNLVIGSANFLLMPLVLAPRYHPALMLTPALFILGYAVALWQYLHELSPVTDEVRQAFGYLNTRLSEALDGVETVKGAAQEYHEVGLFERNARRFRNAFVRQGDIEARFIPLLLMGMANAGGLLHALYLFRQGALQVGDVVAYSSGLAGARRILELINRENNLDQNLKGYAAPLQGSVEFRDVSFAYPDGERVLDGISLRVEPGQTVAIVGQTGAGKTTLTRLINRTYDTTSGQVLVDGVDVRDWQLESLRGQISFIEQDIFLFSRSIAENIAFGRRDASREEIIAAAKAAQAHEFILSFENGYDTVIGERGVTLSGGQRQRLELARAFLTRPGILVLDDSTSAIDSATEDKIQQAIAAASHGRTMFIITHRLSQIRWADIILVIRKGRLIAVGTHNDLMRTSPAYRQIFDTN